MPRPPTLFLAFFLLLLVVLPLLPLAHADYPDNFDTYAPGTVNPGPWSFNPDSGVCWTGAVAQGVVNQLVPLTFPNTYQVTYHPACDGVLHSAFFAVGINATSNSVTFEIWVNSSTPVGGASDGLVGLTMCGVVENLLVNGTNSGNPLLDLNIVKQWTSISATIATSIGGACSGGFQVKVESTSTNSAGFAVNFDDAVITGANAVTSAANFYLIQYSTQTWFPISAFPNSYLRINYNHVADCSRQNFVQASPNVCLSNSPLNIPDLSLMLNNSVLVTLNLNGSVPYTRTIIPQPNLLNSTTPSAQRMYLDIPQACPSICSYQLTINDFTGQYSASSPPPFTQIYIQQGGFVITSAPLDGQSVMAMTMQPGIYNFTIISFDKNNTNSQPLSLTATNDNPSILIQNSTNPVTIGPFQQFSYAASWDCDAGGITSTVFDSLGTMTHEVLQLYRVNTTSPGGILIGSHTFSTTGPPGFSVSYDFRNSTFGAQNLNFSTPNEYLVNYVLTTPQGVQNFGRYPVTYNPSCTHLPNSIGSTGGGFTIPPGVLGLSQIFSVSNAYEFLLGLVVCILTTGIVAARMSHIIMLVLGAEVGLLGLMNWFPPGALALSPVFLFVGVVGVLVNRSRRPIT